jgi:iron complex outermembrane recepter protein
VTQLVRDMCPWRCARPCVLLLAAGAMRAPAALAQSPLIIEVRTTGDDRPIVGATVHLIERDRMTLTDAMGRARMLRLAHGPVTLSVRSLGYAPSMRRLTLPLRDSIVRVTLRASAMSLGTVVVTGAGGPRRADEVYQPTTVLDGPALDRAATMSIAGTLAGEPGITQRTNGPIAAQPVVRGLSGDRVLVLEDGQRMGDIASTAPDHQITADPMAVRRLEVVRGPAGLLYGSNTVGGVINIIREDVPRARPDHLTGSLSAQGESNNAAGTVGGRVLAPAGPLALRLDVSYRTAGNSVTPAGTLPFTNMQATDGGAGVSWAGARGHAGVAVRDFRNTYGVPTSLAGLTLPGAHDGGIYIDVQRTTTRVDAEYRPAARAITSVSLSGNFVRFAQDEREQGGFVGTRFGQLASQGDVVVRYRRRGALPATGAIGAFGQWRDFRATGSFTGTRPAVLVAGALYAFEEHTLGRVRLLAGARYDATRIRPLDSTETRLLQGIHTRQFGALSGSVAAHVDVGGGVTVGTAIARAFRTPAIEELYSAGPHLAAFAYEVGTPTLRAEYGVGADVFARWTRTAFTAEVAAFRTRIDDFIYQQPQVDAVTGLPERDPRLRRYAVYRARQTDAQLTGTEGRAQWEPRAGWVLDATASYVRGDDRTRGSVLPAMPPLRGRLQVRRETARLTLGLGSEFIGAQDRVPLPLVQSTVTCAVARGNEREAEALPAEFCRTAGAVLLSGTAGVRFTLAGHGHALTAVLDNAAAATWRDHLWRAKQVAPQPGRNVRLLYRVHF